MSEATELVSALAGPLAEAGYGLGMCGSVLKNGHSNHDLDLVVFPLRTDRGILSVAKSALRKNGVDPLYDRSVVTSRWRKLGSGDEKHVEVWEYKGKRVDIFFLK